MRGSIEPGVRQMCHDGKNVFPWARNFSFKIAHHHKHVWVVLAM